MKCDTCNTDFTPETFFEDTDQAHGCAASLYLLGGQYYILAHYGSKFDMQRFSLKKGSYETGNVCDECIDKMINTGVANMIEDGVW